MQAPWSPVDSRGRIIEPIREVVAVLRRGGLIGRDPGPNMTLAELNALGQAEWATGPNRERADLPPRGEDLVDRVWGPFTEAGFTGTRRVSVWQVASLLATWGGAAACADKFGFAAEEVGRGVNFGAFVSLAADRKLQRDGSGIDSDAKLFHPQIRYGGLELWSTKGAEGLVYEADMIWWLWNNLKLPQTLRGLTFWQVAPHQLRQAGVMRATALEALALWPGRDKASGHYCVLGKGPHFPFQALDFADALGPNATVEWIGPGIEPGFVPNSVAQLFDALTRAVNSYIKFEERQGRHLS